MSKPLAIGSDHAGFGLKEHLKQTLGEMGVEIEDLGTHDESSTDYPDHAHALAKGIEDGTF